MIAYILGDGGSTLIEGDLPLERPKFLSNMSTSAPSTPHPSVASAEPLCVGNDTSSATVHTAHAGGSCESGTMPAVIAEGSLRPS